MTSVEELLAGKQHPVLVSNFLCLHHPKNVMHGERGKLNFLLVLIKGRTFLWVENSSYSLIWVPSLAYCLDNTKGKTCGHPASLQLTASQQHVSTGWALTPTSRPTGNNSSLCNVCPFLSLLSQEKHCTIYVVKSNRDLNTLIYFFLMKSNWRTINEAHSGSILL